MRLGWKKDPAFLENRTDEQNVHSLERSAYIKTDKILLKELPFL